MKDQKCTVLTFSQEHIHIILGVDVLYVFQYVAVIITFKLFRTSITLREEPNVPEILKVQMIDLSTSISQRPGAQAIK